MLQLFLMKYVQYESNFNSPLGFGVSSVEYSVERGWGSLRHNHLNGIWNNADGIG